jgi:hypothetical protein
MADINGHPELIDGTIASVQAEESNSEYFSTMLPFKD